MKYSTFYTNSKAEGIVNKIDIDNLFKSIYTSILSNIQKSHGKVLVWIIDSVVDHSINISKSSRLAGSSYIKLPKELDYPKKGLITIQNFDDNQCFKWCLMRYLHPVDHHPARIRKVDRMFEEELDFTDKKFPIKIRDIHRIEKKNCISINVFEYENKEKYLLYVPKNTFKTHVDLLLLEGKDKKHYVLIKDFDTFIYDHTFTSWKIAFLVIKMSH